MLIERLERSDDATVVFQNNRAISGRELAAHARALAGALAARGIGAGDRVALVLPNCKELIAALAACERIGAAAAPIEPSSTGPELARALAPLAPRAIFVLARALNVLDDARRALPETIVVQTGEDESRPGEPPAGVIAYEALIDAAQPAPARATTSTALLAHLSWRGRGRPQYALLDAEATLESAVAAAKATGVAAALESGGAIVAGAPFYRPSALAISVLAPIVLGRPLVVLKQLRARMLLQLIASHDVTAVAAPPALLSLAARFHGESPIDLSRVQAWVSTAAPPPTPERTSEIEAALGRPLLWGYGAAEAPWALAVSPEQAAAEKPGERGLGDPIGAEVRVRVVGLSGPGQDGGTPVATGEVPAAGQPGAIFVSGRWAAGSVLGGSAEDAPGVLGISTGDRARLGPGGRLHLVPRESVCTVAAYEVDLEEVAAAIREHPKVALASAHPVPDPEGCGAHVRAIVGLAPDAETSVAELIDFLRPRLAYYKMPQSFRFRRAATA